VSKSFRHAQNDGKIYWRPAGVEDSRDAAH